MVEIKNVIGSLVDVSRDMYLKVLITLLSELAILLM